MNIRELNMVQIIPRQNWVIYKENMINQDHKNCFKLIDFHHLCMQLNEK